MTATTEAPPRKWTEADVKAALWRHYTAAGWAVLTEVSLTDGDEKVARDRRIDILCVRKARRLGIGPIELLAIEVKVTRGDFLQDVRCPEKQAPWRALAHRHAYAVPAGLVAPEEVPGGSFLITIEGQQPGWDKVDAPRSSVEVKVPTIPPRLFIALMFRLATAEANAKGLNPWADRHGDPEAMRATIERLQKDLETAERARDRAMADRNVWRSYAKGLTGIPCATCGHELRASRRDPRTVGGLHNGFGWKHPDKAHEEACAVLRREARRQEYLESALRDHERWPDTYPAVDPETWQPRYDRDPGPTPKYDDEETPTHG